MKDYLKLLRFSRGFWGVLALATLCMGISTIFEGITFSALAPILDRIFNRGEILLPGAAPLFLTTLINRLNSVEPLVFLKFLTFLVPLLFLLKGIVLFIQDYLMNIIGQGVVRQVRNRLYAKFQELSMDFYGKRRTGELMSRVTNDVALITNAISYGLKDLIFEAMKVGFFAVGTLWLGFRISWKLVLVTFVIFPAIMLPVAKIGKRVKKLSLEVQKRIADLNSHMAETIQGAHIVKAFCREDYEIERFKAINQHYYRYNLKAIKRTLALPPLTEFIGVCLVMFVVRTVAPEVLVQKVSFGIFAVFIAFLSNMIRPMKKLSNVYAINQLALAASARIYDILEQRIRIQEIPQAKILTGFRENIRFEDVWFAYNEDDGYVIRGVDLEIRKGETIALVGHSGVGKSTLAGLILRFYDPQRGRVTIDGIDIKQVTVHSLRSLISIVSQDTVLFNASVRDNIAYGRLDASEAAIIEAAQKAYALEFITQIPQKFSTVVGDRGFRLSGGEKQRIAIARALLKDAPLLILDEATSNLDTASEKLIKQALETLMAGKTTIVIAHRLSTVQKADKIIVLDKGRIVETGTHQQLLGKDSLYKKLYNLQFSL